MPDRSEILLRFYEEDAAQARQHESQRERFTNLFLAISAGAIALIARYPDERVSVITALFLIAFGVLGALVSLKHYERHRYHRMVMRGTRDAIDRELEESDGPEPRGPSLGQIREESKEEHVKCIGFALLRHMRLYLLWTGIPLFISLVGLVSLMFLIERRVMAW